MKFTGQLATLATIMVSAGSAALAVSCGNSGKTPATNVGILRSDLATNSQNYRVSGRGLSQFDQVGSASLTMRRVSGIPSGSTHVAASIAGNIVQNITDDCCGGKQFCCRNDNVQGDQGDTVNVNIAC